MKSFCMLVATTSVVLLFVQNENGLTALTLANLKGHTQVVELLLKESVDVKVQNMNGATGLVLTSLNNHIQVVELLLKENPNVNIKNQDDYTTLMLASVNGHVQVVELLLKDNNGTYASYCKWSYPGCSTTTPRACRC